MPSDGNSSYGQWPGELKLHLQKISEANQHIYQSIGNWENITVLIIFPSHFIVILLSNKTIMTHCFIHWELSPVALHFLLRSYMEDCLFQLLGKCQNETFILLNAPKLKTLKLNMHMLKENMTSKYSNLLYHVASEELNFFLPCLR